MERRDDEARLAALLARVGPRPSPPEAARDRVHAAVRAELAALRRARRQRWVGGVGLALAASLVLALGLRFGLAPDTPLPTVMALRVIGEVTDDAVALAPGSALQPGSRLSVGAGSGLALGLGGRASLRVAAGSVLQYTADGAFALERGTVYFDSHGDRAAAIELRTPYGSVRDLGTQFETALVERGLRVRVREGSVEIGAERTPVSAGVEYLLVDGLARYAQVAGDAPDWDWAEQLASSFELDGASVDAYLRWVAREGGLRLVYADASVATAAQVTNLRGSAPDVAPVESLDSVLPATRFLHRIAGSELRIERETP